MKNIDGNMSSIESQFGSNVEGLLKITRHGDRDPKTNRLTEAGEEMTADYARKSGIGPDDYEVIHAIGSTVDPYDDEKGKNMGRAERTAQIYAATIAGERKFATRKTEVLAYNKLTSPVPYNHKEVYGSFLPKNFNDLSLDEKVAAGIVAQGKLTEYVLSLNTPEASKYKEEAAGSIAYLINHYRKAIHHVHSGKKLLIPAGIHGPTMEFFLQRALIRRNKDGSGTRGFEKLSDIGGQHNVSESFSVKFGTNEKGEDSVIGISFDNPDRPSAEQMFIDSKVVEELSRKFEELHPELRGLREKQEN